MIKSDFHMHSSFSGDSDALMEDMVEAAINKQLDIICFTEHMDYDFPVTKTDPPGLFEVNTSDYMNRLLTVKDSYKDRINVCFGIELGLMPYLKERYRALTSSYPFDFVIGSSHLVNGRDPYYPAYYEGRSEHSAYLEYFESILENVNVYEDYDVYGHLDYVVRYGPNKNSDYSLAQYSDVIDEILRCLIDRGKGIEVNTAGFKYGLSHPNPTEDIIKRYVELGGEILTIGSDAHSPENVAYDFARGALLLKECNVRYYTVFTNRKPSFRPL